MSGRNDDDDQSDRDDLSNLDVEEETLVDGGKATFDEEEVPGIVQEAETELVDGGTATCDREEVPGVVQEAGTEVVEVMAVAVDMAGFADDVNECEERPSHLSADGEND